MRDYVLVVDPGSTSTKVGIFKGERLEKSTVIDHSTAGMVTLDTQLEKKRSIKEDIFKWLRSEGIELERFQAVAGRGGLLRPVSSGTYEVSDLMVDDLHKASRGNHASNLGAIIAREIGDECGARSFTVDPVSVDEFDDVSRISGLAEIERKSLLHALNIRAVSRMACSYLDKRLEEANLVVVHMGGGISVAAMRNGRMIDANNSNEMGPFTPERSGTLPVGELVEMSFSGEFTLDEMIGKMSGSGGMVSYLGTGDIKEVERRIDLEDDSYARFILEAMAYQISKEIGGAAAALRGLVDAIIFTGGVAHSNRMVEMITDRVSFISPVISYPGDYELGALNHGVRRVLDGLEEAMSYDDEVARREARDPY